LVEVTEVFRWPDRTAAGLAPLGVTITPPGWKLCSVVL
jgi:hypothetical protein